MYQNFIPFYDQIIFRCIGIPHFVCPFIHRWTFRLFHFLAVMNHTSINIHIHFLGELMFSVYLYRLGVDLTGYMITLFNFEGLSHFSEDAAQFYILTNHVWGFQFLHIFINSSCCLFDCSHSSGCEVVPHCKFDLNFPNDEYCGTITFSYAYWPFVYHLWRNVCSDPLPILKLVVFLLLSFKRFFCVFILDKCSYQIYDMQIVLAFTFRSVIHFELIFGYRVNKGPTSFFCMCISNCPSTICWKDYSFPCWMFLTLLLKISWP